MGGGSGGARQLPDGEVQKRVAVLKRFKELLERQKAKFASYLDVLDRQKGDIERGDVDKLVAHVELEQQVVSEIFAIQKVIDPMEQLYQATHSGASLEIPVLKSALDEMKAEVVKRNASNREMLKKRMDLIRNEMTAIRANPAYRRRSVFADEGGASVIDIEG